MVKMVKNTILTTRKQRDSKERQGMWVKMVVTILTTRKRRDSRRIQGFG